MTSTTTRFLSLSSPPRPAPAQLPSLPPSPSLLDEVFSHPRPWSEEFSSRGSTDTKGKEKQSLEDNFDDDDDGDHDPRRVEAYPPMTDQVAETRRVEETLKRWELAERQRRKSARESSAQHAGPSLLATVTRTASIVFSGRTPNGGAAPTTRTFKSHDAVDVAREGYGVPLDDIDAGHASPPTNVVVHSPVPSVFGRDTSMDIASGSSSENPFEHPSERTPSPSPLPSPFSDTRAQRAHAHTRSKESNGSGGVPPPRPLGLPASEHTAPLQPTPQPVLRPPPRQDPEERQEVRWWHDWLCGCGEGPDRGGDNQAGRTNPFE